MNSKTFADVKKLLDNCQALDKEESIKRLISGFKITREKALEYYSDWRKDFMKGLNIQALYPKFQPVGIIVRTDSAMYEITTEKIKILKEYTVFKSCIIPDEILDLDKIRKDLISKHHLGYIGNE
ncbi:MAG: hypothetical protein Q8936_25285 [Bacillota bacterium]|nr:hypothetical protein [Bacillota bacterium]